jgi:hypothetical protein
MSMLGGQTLERAGRKRNQLTKLDLKNEKGGKFRIVIGIHIGDGPASCECENCSGDNRSNHIYRAREPGDPPEYTGDIIESKQDLCLRCNHGPFSTKYERIDEARDWQSNEEARRPDETLEAYAQRLTDLAISQKENKEAPTKEAVLAKPVSAPVKKEPAPVLKDFNSMNMRELQDYAAENEIDLKGASKREDVVRILRNK